MSFLDRAVGHIATAKTFAFAFWPWLVAAGLAGAGMAGYASFKVTRAFYRGEALEARLQLSKFETSLATARTELLARSQTVADVVLENRDVEKNRLDAVAADVRELGRRVQSCATKSDVRISVTPAGAIQAVPDGQLRVLADSIQEFAEACARERDEDATDHNALIDWIEGLKKQPR